MNLGQMLFEVRSKLAEPTALFWSDQEIINWLNEACKIMCSECQPIQAMLIIPSVVGKQEYVLPPDLDEIFGVQYQQSNTIFDLRHTNPMDAQAGNYVSAIPSFFYTRSYTSTTSGKLSTGSLDKEPIDPANGNAYRKVLGLYPVPSGNGQNVIVNYFATHYIMRMPSDHPMIAPEFQRGVIAYALAMAKEKEEAYAELNQIYLPMFQQFKEQMKKKMINRSDVTALRKAKVQDDYEYFGDSTSIIFIPGA